MSISMLMTPSCMPFGSTGFLQVTVCFDLLFVWFKTCYRLKRMDLTSKQTDDWWWTSCFKSIHSPNWYLIGTVQHWMSLGIWLDRFFFYTASLCWNRDCLSSQNRKNENNFLQSTAQLTFYYGVVFYVLLILTLNHGTISTPKMPSY